MPENQNPVTKTEPEGAAVEFDFAKPEPENPRVKRRSLKAKPAGLIKPNPAALPAARELEREAPPRTTEAVAKTPAAAESPRTTTSTPTAKVAATAPPRVTPTVAAPASSTSKPSASATTSTPAASPTSSPHGTRPATLYYSTNTRKAETPSPMKTIPSASAASSASSAATVTPTASARPVSATASRPAPNVDYRANVERQSREQKSVGSILSYIVYGFIALFVITAGLAAYGADIIFKQLHEQSATVSDLDGHYKKVTDDLTTKLASTQDTLASAQAQIARQQDLIVKQQEELNHLISISTDNDTAIKAEKFARAQDSANLRARVKELEAEYRATQKY